MGKKCSKHFVGKRIFILTIVVFSWVLGICAVEEGWAATYYMPDNFANLQSAMFAMSAGDTLIIRDGTYTGASNQITSTAHPPVSSTTWTSIKAEHDGEVFFGDPNSNVSMLYVESTGNSHWQFEGITWLGGGTHLGAVSYVKFLRCGSGSNLVTGCPIPFSNNVSSYLLYEDCHAWGGGRYMFSSYLSDHNIYRRCVGRTDAAITTHDGKNEPIGGIAIYGSSYCEVQNCILIDIDTPSYWVYESLPGALTCPNGTGSNVFFRGNIVLNSDMPAGGSANGFTAVVRENNILWDVRGATIYGGTTVFDHNTIGVMKTAAANSVGINGYNATITANNTIFNDLDGQYGALYNVKSDYNYFYNNSVNYSGGSSAGSHDVTNVNPLTNSMLYLPRIESGTTLSGVASDGSNIGATVLKKIGVSGTLYGESGYNTTTNNNLWPFPNEGIIKKNFASYSHPTISGARGFAATGKQLNGTDDITLTSYIWEYLGNQLPSDIYVTGVIVTPAPSGLIIK